MDYWARSDFSASPDPRLLRREKIAAIQGRDNLTADEQLLQIVAVAELLIAQDAQPKICVDLPVCV
jgi:hypothetical protein